MKKKEHKMSKQIIRIENEEELEQIIYDWRSFIAEN